MKFKNIWLSIVMLFFQFFVINAHACYFMNGGKTGKLSINIGSISVPNDAEAPVGTVLATKQGTITSLGGTVPGEFSCGGDSGKIVTESMMLSGDGSTVRNAVYPTNIKGIGVRLYYYSAVSFKNEPTTPTPLYTTFPYTIQEYRESYQNINAAFKIEIVKSSSIAEMGTSGALSFSALSVMKAEVTDLLDLTITGDVKVPSCYVDASTSKSIAMGSIYQTEIPNIGDVAKEKDITFNISCSAVVAMNIKVSGSENSDVKDQGIIALKSEDGRDPGIGAQILYSGKPVNLEQNIVVGQSISGMNKILLGVQYYRTNKNIIVGSINGVFTVDFNYN
ncbi:fimbrial protein [Enterobacter quasiroggenkampii]|uniref:fimbrial protein n=1 Tax=Enterobacter quasiroggenkampii TaxID=2497436 RepID=UPI0021D2C820|nr:fimbrial protein [Enterobacter quasiroggenkampii]MCU6306627.1 fimbrial protein [Enterobacter quasiroggenkampii]